jgi:hypothetical protein
MTSSIGKINLSDPQSSSIWGLGRTAFERSFTLPQFSGFGFELLLSCQGFIHRTQSSSGTSGRPSLIDSQLFLVALQCSGEFLYSFAEMLPAGFNTNEPFACLAQLIDLTQD